MVQGRGGRGSPGAAVRLLDLQPDGGGRRHPARARPRRRAVLLRRRTGAGAAGAALLRRRTAEDTGGRGDRYALRDGPRSARPRPAAALHPAGPGPHRHGAARIAQGAGRTRPGPRRPAEGRSEAAGAGVPQQAGARRRDRLRHRHGRYRRPGDELERGRPPHHGLDRGRDAGRASRPDLHARRQGRGAALE